MTSTAVLRNDIVQFVPAGKRNKVTVVVVATDRFGDTLMVHGFRCPSSALNNRVALDNAVRDSRSKEETWMVEDVEVVGSRWC